MCDAPVSFSLQKDTWIAPVSSNAQWKKLSSPFGASVIGIGLVERENKLVYFIKDGKPHAAFMPDNEALEQQCLNTESAIENPITNPQKTPTAKPLSTTPSGTPQPNVKISGDFQVCPESATFQITKDTWIAPVSDEPKWKKLKDPFWGKVKGVRPNAAGKMSVYFNMDDKLHAAWMPMDQKLVNQCPKTKAAIPSTTEPKAAYSQPTVKAPLFITQGYSMCEVPFSASLDANYWASLVTGEPEWKNLGTSEIQVLGIRRSKETKEVLVFFNRFVRDGKIYAAVVPSDKFSELKLEQKCAAPAATAP